MLKKSRSLLTRLGDIQWEYIKSVMTCADSNFQNSMWADYFRGRREGGGGEWAAHYRKWGLFSDGILRFKIVWAYQFGRDFLSELFLGTNRNNSSLSLCSNCENTIFKISFTIFHPPFIGMIHFMYASSSVIWF